MKKQKQNTPKTKRRHIPFSELPPVVQKALNNMKVSYTVETIAEYIHPDVKARLEAQKKAESKDQ